MNYQKRKPRNSKYQPSEKEKVFQKARLLLELTNTVVPQRGSVPMSFTRASVRRELDYSGLFVELLSGEVGFRGARRVRNLIATTSEDFTNAAWTKNAATAAIVGGVSRITATATTSAYATQSIPISGTPANKVFRVTAKLRGSKNGIAGLSHFPASPNDFTHLPTATYFPITTEWGIYTSSLAVIGATASTHMATAVYLSAGSATFTTVGDWIDVAWIQLEEVTGQSNQNPSEYVSVGALSSPFHGAMVDGVKWFTRENPNIVVGNVVQEITGVAVPEIPYPQVLKGYTPMPAATNLLTYSGDLTNAAWTKAASVASIATYPPRLLKESLPSQLRDDATAASIHGMFRNPTVTANTNYCAWLVVHSSGERYRGRIGFLDAATSSNGVICEFNARTGVTAAAAIGTGTLAGSGYINVAKGWGIVYVSGKIDAATTAAQVQFLIADSAGNLVYDGDGVSRMILGHFQLETGTVPTNIIPTTSAAVTVAGDVHSIPSAGIVSGAQGSAYIEFEVPINAGTPQALFSIDGGSSERIYCYYNAGKIFLIVTVGGVTQANPDLGAVSPGSVVKVAVRWSENDVAAVINGGASVVDTSATMPTINAIRVGNSAGGSVGYGAVPNFRAWNSLLTDAELKAITANGYRDQAINTLGWVDSPQISHDGRRLYFMYSRYDFAPLLIDGASLTDLSAVGGERSWHVAIPHPSYDGDVYCAYLRHNGTVERIENLRFDPNYDDFSLQTASAESSIMEVAATSSLPKRIYYNANRYGDVPKLVYRQEDANGVWTAELTTELATVSSGGSGAGYIDDNAFVTDDRLGLVFASTRAGGEGSSDIWISTRAGPTDVWGAPTNAGTNINTSGHEDQIFLHPNGTDCWFTRDGGIYHCTRSGATINNDEALVTFTGTPLVGGIGEPSTDTAMTYLYFSYLELATGRIRIMRAPWDTSVTEWGTPVAID